MFNYLAQVADRETLKATFAAMRDATRRS